MSRDSESGIVPENKDGFTISASPLNQIKLELGAILIMAVALLFIVGFIVDSKASQMLVLISFSLTSMAWLIFRVKRTMKDVEQNVE